MSTVLASASPTPLVTSGMASAPPVPVLAVTPVPSRRNQVSIVNCERPSAGATPKVA